MNIFGYRVWMVKILVISNNNHFDCIMFHKTKLNPSIYGIEKKIFWSELIYKQ